MDESLEDYISKSNFKVKVGNPGFQSKKRNFQGNQVTDVSITVPAVRKTGPNVSRTNQMRDARDRLVAKAKPQDARDKLLLKNPNTDARQKLNVIRSQKEPVDARAKIQAKKQGQVVAGPLPVRTMVQAPGQSVGGPSLGGNFTLTRTVSNNNNNNIQLTPGPKGNISITKTYHHQTVLPKVQVQNDQYRPPEPHYQHYSAPPQPPPVQPHPAHPQYVYQPPPTHPVYYETPGSPPREVHTYTEHLQEPAQTSYYPESPSDVASFQRTIVNDTHVQNPVKKRPAEEPLRSSATSGPLRFSSSNYVPIIQTTGHTESVKSQKSKLTKTTAPGEPVIKRLKQEDDENVISPLQGYKITITNIAATVTQEDLLELFGAMGAVKRVKLLKQGVAEVVYVSREDAVLAASTYNDRELDGLAMSVKMTTPASAKVKAVSEKLPASETPVASGPLRLSKGSSSKNKQPGNRKDLDVTTLHKALFKTGSSSSSKPVTFTVNI